MPKHFLFHDNQMLNLRHYCTRFTTPTIKLFVLPTMTHKCSCQILELLYKPADHPDQVFSKGEVSQFSQHLSTSQYYHKHLRNNRYMLEVASAKSTTVPPKSKQLILRIVMLTSFSATLCCSIQGM